MFRSVFIALLLISGLVASAQTGGLRFASENRLTARQLSEQLTANRQTELEKVTAIFRWITENIAYRSSITGKRTGNMTVYEEDTNTVLQSLNERVSEIVLANRLAVCDGYARLFKTLCDHAGLRSEIISGFVRNQSRRTGLKFQTNHSWNAVMIDGKWEVLDPTWASGYVNSSGQFVQQYDPTFFLMNSSEMLRTHYPENPFWTMSATHKAPAEFEKQPLKYFAWHKFYVSTVSPAAGVIDVVKGQPIEIVMETKEQKSDLVLSTAPFHLPFAGQLSSTATQRDFEVNGHTIKGKYVPGDEKPECLYVILNGEVILRYHLRYRSV